MRLLTGDHSEAARRIAEGAGLDGFDAELKPDQKYAVIEKLREQGRKVIFVGDGINDGPALAAADVGVAMGASGTDVALETADVALMRDDLTLLPEFVNLGRRTLRIIKWNIAFGMLFNALAVLAGGWGLLTPIMGAVVHNVGSVLVVLNSARLGYGRWNAD
jgi:Cd2+/Zn2+-exporting ATPase